MLRDRLRTDAPHLCPSPDATLLCAARGRGMTAARFAHAKSLVRGVTTVNLGSFT